MMLVAIKPRRPLAPHSTCGHAPHLIEARGRVCGDLRLLGTPARAWHVECSRCGVSTQIHPSARLAELAWCVQADLVDITALPTLRLAAERARAAAA
ncbi:hypothetical protein H9645_03765 [Luteimonas sp. Sa2BVA3]|uniref:Uncharacterized protein n=1 Tax=Luteimonas colneyensis TaxID=2762230 RepID=A0ABR8UHK7_9GAMM|nr:hypothetical protein [Luteimonas colneyensis]MBD7987139.1 hypothetical protein [Luteimonas colneyensis]